MVDIARAVSKLTAPLRRRVALTVRMGVVRLVRDALATQELQVSVLDGETLDKVKSILPYGFTHHPHPGDEVVVLALGGSTSNTVAVAVGGRTFRLHPLAEGEVAIHDDQDQKVHLMRDGVVVETPFKATVTVGSTVTVTAPEGIRFETPKLEVTGEIIDRVDASGRTMSDMRARFNAHVHPENDGGGPTSPPTESM